MDIWNETVEKTLERINLSTELLDDFMKKEKKKKSELAVRAFLEYLDNNDYMIVKSNYKLNK